MIKPFRITTAVVVLAAPLTLLSDGYRNSPEGAQAIGMFGGHRAFADDANANIHNSANLVDLEQPMIQYNVAVGYGTTSFDNGAVSESTENPYFAIPGFSAAMPFKDGKYAVGISFYVPYGRSAEWSDTGYFANNGASYAGSMLVTDLTPNFAIRLNDSLSIGIGADLYYASVKQWTYIPGILKTKLTASGQAIGWNAALTWKMTEKQRLAATYRSPFTIKYTGENNYSGFINGTSDASAKIEYPDILGLAYGIELTDTLKIEVDGEWLGFSQYKNLTLYDSTFPTTTYSQDLKDTWTAGLGASWNFKPQWTLRSGFMYLKNPTPDYTYGPLSPDADQCVISVGLGYETEHHAIDVAYAYGLFLGGRSVSDNQYAFIDGDYDYNVHLLALSYGYKF
jgi:long-subunit fatty acid transport protein